MSKKTKPTPMIMHCPECGNRHIDQGVFATKPHHTHACQHCGFVWRPAVVATVGVKFLPGFKDVGLTTTSWTLSRDRTTLQAVVGKDPK